LVWFRAKWLTALGSVSCKFEKEERTDDDGVGH